MTYRSTWVPPRPRQWPFLVSALTALLILGGAVLLSAPGLYLVAYVPVAWFFLHLWHCFMWGVRHGEDIEGAFR
jgi:hypothetical protein